MKQVDLTQSALSSLEGLLRVKKLIRTIKDKLQEDEYARPDVVLDKDYRYLKKYVENNEFLISWTEKYKFRMTPNPEHSAVKLFRILWGMKKTNRGELKLDSLRFKTPNGEILELGVAEYKFMLPFYKELLKKIRLETFSPKLTLKQKIETAVYKKK